MRAARRSTLVSVLSAIVFAAAALSCGGDSTGPGGGDGGITITPDSSHVALGASVTLHAQLTGSGGSGATFFWSSENTSVATVSSSGVVTAVAIGTVHIAASSSGHSGVATVFVVPPGVSSVRVTPSSAAIKVGETVHLQAEPLDASGNVLTDRTVTWASSNTAVATVDNDGVVSGVTTGAITITATSEGKSGTSGIAVGAAVPASITVAPTSVSITTGQTSQLTATVKDANGVVISGAPVQWSVDNSGNAIVSSTGLVTGQNAGAATVTATSGSVHVDVPVTITIPPANAVIVSPSTVSLLITQTQQLTATVTDAGGHTIPGTVTWQSSNTNVATVSSTGLVTAVFLGTATITGTSGTVSGTSKVTVSLVPTRRVTVDPDALAFTQGDPGTQLTVTLLDSIGGTLSPANRPVAWSSSKTSVATVSGTGFVTPGAPGQAVITASATGTGLFGTSSVTVAPVPVASVAITPSLDTLIVLQQVQLAAVAKDAGGNTLAGRAIVWDGSDDNVASVSSAGKVIAIAPGTMTVTATSEGKTGTATIVVLAVPVATVAISPTSQTVLVGSNTPAFTAVVKDASGNVLNGRTITFASSDPTVATINASTGVATGVAPGTTSITASSEGKTSPNATLTVSAIPVASVTISPTTATVVAGDATPAFTAVTKDGSGNVLTGRTVTFSSSDPSIATVNSTTGIATGVTAGSVSIIATSEGKDSPAATLTVTPVPVASVIISPSSQSTTVGSSPPAFSAVAKDAGGNTLPGRVITFASSNTGVATINSTTGVATGVAVGTTSITASSGGKTSTAATLTVAAAPVASVTISPTTQSVVAGSSTPAFTAVTKDAGGNVLTGRAVAFTSSDPTVATINSSTGVATGVAPGTTSITASSEGKTSTGATLTVSAAPVASVTISPTTQSVVDGSSTPAFTAVTKDAGGNVLTGRVVTFASSDPTVATINSSTGVATGASPGTTSITATSEGKVSSAATLTVTAVPVNNVVINPSSQAVDVGSTVAFVATPRDASNNPLSGRMLVYSSSDPSIASIDGSTGVATGVAPGSVTIGAISEGKVGTASLTVNPAPVASVSVAPSSQSVIAGNTTASPFVATVRDGGGNVLTGRTVSWQSSDNSIATVDGSGNATGVSAGSVTITATSEGHSGTASLTVTPVAVASVDIAPPILVTTVGATTQFTATPRDAGGNALTGRVVTWRSSDETMATVDNTGLVTGVALGFPTITASSEGVDSASVIVTVLGLPVP